MLTNRRSIENRGMPRRDLYRLGRKPAPTPLYPEDKIMQSDQRTTHHPVPSRSTERTSGNDGNGNAAASRGIEKSKDSSDRHDAVKPAIGRRPARSNENTPKRRR